MSDNLKVKLAKMNDELRMLGLLPPPDKKAFVMVRPEEADVPGLPEMQYRPTSMSRAQNQQIPEGSGVAYVGTPYANYYNQLWGVSPLSDVTNGNYMNIYRTVPIAKASVDKICNYLAATEVTFSCSKDNPKGKEICAALERWLFYSEYPNKEYKKNRNWSWNSWRSICQRDREVFGFCMSELVYDDMQTKTEPLDDKDKTEFQKFGLAPKTTNTNTTQYDTDIASNMTNASGYVENKKAVVKLNLAKGRPLWLKPLDPRYARVRRDSLGNVYGGILWTSTPPVAFTPEKMFFSKRNPTSWQNENAYGTSRFMALLKIQNMIWILEDDLMALSHACVKPPIIVFGGSKEQPYDDTTLGYLNTILEQRGPGSDLKLRGDCTTTQLALPSQTIDGIIKFLEYLHQMRTQLLGVPPQLLGKPEGSSRTTADVSMTEFVASLRADDKAFWEDVREQVFPYVLPWIWEDLGIPEEYREIPQVELIDTFTKDRFVESQRAQLLYSSKILTKNEARVEAGYDPIEGEDDFAVDTPSPFDGGSPFGSPDKETSKDTQPPETDDQTDPKKASVQRKTRPKDKKLTKVENDLAGAASDAMKKYTDEVCKHKGFKQ
jgi:hypothetical protein